MRRATTPDAIGLALDAVRRGASTREAAAESGVSHQTVAMQARQLGIPMDAASRRARAALSGRSTPLPAPDKSEPWGSLAEEARAVAGDAAAVAAELCWLQLPPALALAEVRVKGTPELEPILARAHAAGLADALRRIASARQGWHGIAWVLERLRKGMFSKRMELSAEREDPFAELPDDQLEDTVRAWLDRRAAEAVDTPAEPG
jgi:hypothetical protein